MLAGIVLVERAVAELLAGPEPQGTVHPADGLGMAPQRIVGRLRPAKTFDHHHPLLQDGRGKIPNLVVPVIPVEAAERGGIGVPIQLSQQAGQDVDDPRLDRLEREA